MKTQLLLAILIITLLAIKFCFMRKGRDVVTDPTISPPKLNPENDKIVIVRNASYDDVRKAAKQFCGKYNDNDNFIVLRLIELSDNETAVTFPQNIYFDMFCYFINYMKYPENISYHADIKAWATTHASDTWINEQSVGKHVMLHIPDNDTEHDNVYLTTDDNIEYKLGFAGKEEMQLLSTSKLKYIQPVATAASLSEFPEEVIK